MFLESNKELPVESTPFKLEKRTPLTTNRIKVYFFIRKIQIDSQRVILVVFLYKSIALQQKLIISLSILYQYFLTFPYLLTRVDMIIKLFIFQIFLFLMS